MFAPWKKIYDKPRQHIKKQRHQFVNNSPSSQRYGFSSSHVWMWELDHKESWAPKKWWFQIVALEKTLESPLGYKNKPVNPIGNQPWIFIGRTDAEAEAPILWPLNAKSRLTGKDPDAGKGWRWEAKGMIMRLLDGITFLILLSLSRLQELVIDREAWLCCSPWGCKELDTTEQLNWTEEFRMHWLRWYDSG